MGTGDFARSVLLTVLVFARASFRSFGFGSRLMSGLVVTAGGGGGAMQSVACVRHRLMLPDDQTSPQSQHPNAYVQPGITPLVTPYSDQLSMHDCMIAWLNSHSC